MKIHEYQARNLLERYGIPVPPGLVAESAADSAEAFERLRTEHGVMLAVVKAQVHAGGRGKGGGVKLVRSAQEAQRVAATMFSQPLVTPQTGPNGVSVRKVLVSAGVEIDREFYLAIAVDRVRGIPTMMASREGGVEIEQVAADNPDAIVREPINPDTGLLSYQCRKVSHHLKLSGDQIDHGTKIMQQLASLFLDTDAALAEINPLVVTKPSAEHPQGLLIAIDAKINFDDAAMFRHTDLAKLADQHDQDAAEQHAKANGLSYIKLEGNIGCLVNGAGLAMATMDLIKLHGGEPANFLDVGGSASEEAVTEAFRIILQDEHVKGVLVNIFGGIMQCDIIARAIVNAAKHVGFQVPLVVRLEGTNVDLARQILADARSQVPTMQIGSNLADAAQKITTAAAAI